MVAPVSRVASLVPPVAVSPRKPGSVSTDFQFDKVWQLDVDRAMFIHENLHRHVFFQEVRISAELALFERQLLEAFPCP